MFFFQNKNKIKGFTLIELLIVIVIIGILATSLIPRIQGMQDKARYTRVQKDFQDFNAAVFLAQNNTNKALEQITENEGTFGGIDGNLCGGRGFQSNIKLSSLPSDSPCRLAWISALRKIETAAGMSQGSLSSLEKDPWGSPYLLDENDGDAFWTGCGAFDTLHTAGPDGYDTGIDWINAELDTGDNRGINITSYRCPGGF